MRDFAEILTGDAAEDSVLQLIGFAEDIVKVVSSALQGLDPTEAVGTAAHVSGVLEIAAACLARAGDGAFALERDLRRGIFKDKGELVNG